MPCGLKRYKVSPQRHRSLFQMIQVAHLNRIKLVIFSAKAKEYVFTGVGSCVCVSVGL